MEPEQRRPAGANPSCPTERRAAQRPFGQRDQGKGQRDGFDEVEEAQVEGNGVEDGRREYGKTAIASERSENHPERHGGRDSDERQHDPHRDIGSGDLRERCCRQIEAEVLEPPEIDLEPLVEGQPGRVEVGKHPHRGDVLGRILEGKQLAHPERRDDGGGGDSEEQRPDQLLCGEGRPLDRERNRVCPAVLHHLRP